MPEIITTPNALVQTTNGKRFYVNSGLVSINNVETAVVDIDNIGERDIRLNLNPIITIASSDTMTMRIYNNGIITFVCILNRNPDSDGTLENLARFIFPSNTSLKITFQNTDDSSAHSVGVSCYGKFV
tara:strand:- start:91 stop:474 length:384 start_codon:yes stop_codon:yes gene_type:complete